MMNEEQFKNMVLYFALRNPNFILASYYITEKCKTEKEAKEGLDMYWMLKEDEKKCLLSIFKKKTKNKL